MPTKSKLVIESEEHGESDDEEYVVEKVLDVKYNRNKRRREYLLKWEGYNESENTWEPEENLQCHELLEKFHQQHMRSETNPSRRKRKGRRKQLRGSGSVSTRQKHERRPTNSGVRSSVSMCESQVNDELQDVHSGFPPCSQPSIATQSAADQSLKSESSKRSPSVDNESEENITSACAEEIPSPDVVVEDRETSVGTSVEELLDLGGCLPLTGLEKGWEPKILVQMIPPEGSKPSSFIVEYVDREEFECVSREVCNEICPNLVIQYYERIMQRFAAEKERNKTSK